jgi:hypothetical protein
MKFAVGEGTNSANASSILGYLGLKKYDFDHFFNEFFNAWSASL